MGIAVLKHKLGRFGELDRADKWLLLRAVGWLAVARVRLALSPFANLVEANPADADAEAEVADPALLARIGFAVRAAANNVPWRSDCFPQTLAARKLLERYGYASTIHLGVERPDADTLAGHAWLTSGDTVVTGGETMDRYTEVHRL